MIKPELTRLDHFKRTVKICNVGLPILVVFMVIAAVALFVFESDGGVFRKLFILLPSGLMLFMIILAKKLATQQIKQLEEEAS